MTLFKKKAETPKVVETTDQIVARAIDNISADIVTLESKKDGVLGVFRATASGLGSINDELIAKTNQLNSIIDFATEEKNNCEKSIKDNEAVRKKILAILGE